MFWPPNCHQKDKNLWLPKNNFFLLDVRSLPQETHKQNCFFLPSTLRLLGSGKRFSSFSRFSPAHKMRGIFFKKCLRKVLTPHLISRPGHRWQECYLECQRCWWTWRSGWLYVCQGSGWGWHGFHCLNLGSSQLTASPRFLGEWFHYLLRLERFL